MGVCGAFALLAQFVLSVTGRLTYASICERLPTAQATLKARADAYAKKLSTKPVVPSIRVAIDLTGAAQARSLR